MSHETSAASPQAIERHASKHDTHAPPRPRSGVGLLTLYGLAIAMAACGPVVYGSAAAGCSAANDIRSQASGDLHSPARSNYIGDEFADVEHTLLARPDEEIAPTF